MKYENLENIFVIGDVHGCYHTLMNLLQQLPENAELIFVGDLCDKGNFSKDVIEFVINNNYPCVKGNHEHLFEKYILDAVQNNISSPWSSDKRFGGLECIKSYANDIELIKKHLAWIKNLPLYLEIEKYFITHGFALEYYEHKDNQEHYNDFLLNRYYEGDVVQKSEIINIFGHCTFDDVIDGGNFFCIDTSCAYGKKLTAIQLATHTLYQERMDSRDSNYKVDAITLGEYDVYKESFESIASLLIDKSSQYATYDIIANEVLEAIVDKYGEVGKDELLRMQERSQIFPKQIKKVLGNAYVKDFKF
ncbi:MAG: serine/threonine protein phosphatase 1 [Sulfurimonas sp.]|jgi:serine/threonine protein phosphatase 1|uniref:metallophosphoesterase n=1 Tax=Sulfurimonas sp. TaxID=2022749 RepID=UPI0039E41EB6